MSLDDVVPELHEVIPRPKPELLDKDIRKGLKVVNRILASSDDEIWSRRFLLDNFHEYGLPLVTPEYFQTWAKHMNPSGFGALQVPTEIVDCLRRVMPLNIRSAIEIGVYRGGLSFFMAAVFQRLDPEFNLILLDPWDSLLGYDEFAKILNMRKAIPGTSDNFKDQAFDFVFIDGDHNYEGAMLDFVNLGKFAKAMAVHDIHDHTAGVGTPRAWGEMKLELCPTHEVYEIAHGVPRGLGIGLAIRTD